MKIGALVTLVVMVAAGVAFPAVPAWAEAMQAPAEIDLRTKPVEVQLICQCGCTMVVAVCDCSTADSIRADIAGKMDSGMTQQAILTSYLTQYGEKVLAYPVKKGFNWTAWITPFAAVVVGGGLLTYLLRKWVRRHASGSTTVTTQQLTPEEESVYVPRLHEVLRKHF
ncbi:MAG: cytochrome c-type biogenesis protein CcmH [Firmicutes bacterium]|nr:cytochrome c-type biogenesis protein CcmH [Bacillota bacterium]